MRFLRERLSGSSIFCLFICLVFICTSPLTTSATTIMRMDLDEIVEKADRIIVGKVTKIDSSWDKKHERIWTSVTFSIIQGIKGESAESITIKLLGGVIEKENIGLKVAQMPEFKVGEDGLIFLKDEPDLYCPIVGWFQGRFRIYKDKETGLDKIEDNEGHVIDRFQIKEKRLLKHTLSDFVEQINGIMKKK